MRPTAAYQRITKMRKMRVLVLGMMAYIINLNEIQNIAPICG